MKHTREFKESAIQLVLNSNEEIKTIAQDLGMNHKTLYNWVYNYKRENNLQTYNRTSSKISIYTVCVITVNLKLFFGAASSRLQAIHDAKIGIRFSNSKPG